ncbi:hypothetical protein [Giesbergeria anulus]|uniref:Uncharacterized protein n=1 Tax=Giesbergeria anulus TaxID=180197 RepID=A0A1H9E573_9BURK|nr:hypothetical protein [Giesbergeria anulus]SEQ20775.1 hypothetical protein SAMN02982919_00202 [Giesbergeria anulus]
MKDKEFKYMTHPMGDLVIATRGSEVSQGYKPDVTVEDKQGNLKFILEFEQKTDRKAFLGSLLKAEVHAEQKQKSPELIIVMKPFRNTTTRQIADHIRPYKQWLEKKNCGSLNLSAIHVLSDTEYLEAAEAKDQLGTPAFKKRGHIV